MYVQGEMKIVGVRPWMHGLQHPYSIEHQTDGCLKIKGWRKLVIESKPQIGDRWISLLLNRDEGVFLLYFILPKRERSST